MINPTIKPLTEISGYDTRWGWDKHESKANENRFAKRLRRVSDEVSNDERASGKVLNFDNPAFNILTGETNFTVSAIASNLKAN